MSAAGIAGKARELLLPARPFAAGDEGGRQQRAEEQPQARADQAGLDGIFDEEDAAERQRHAADPDRPAGAEFFLEADDALGLRGGSGLRRGGGGGGAARAGEAARLPRPQPVRSAPGQVRGAGGGATGCGVTAGAGAAPGAAGRPRLQRRQARFHPAQAVVDVDGLDQRHDGDDRKRQQHQADAKKNSMSAPRAEVYAS